MPSFLKPAGEINNLVGIILVLVSQIIYFSIGGGDAELIVLSAGLGLIVVGAVELIIFTSTLCCCPRE